MIRRVIDLFLFIVLNHLSPNSYILSKISKI